MSREEVERCVREAQQHAAEDAQLQSVNQAKDRLETLLFRSAEVRKSMDKEKRKRLDETVKQAKAVLRKKDPASMEETSNKLESILREQKS